MISDFKSLAAPLTEDEFLILLRERRLEFLPGSGSRRFETLLNWQMLNQLLDAGTYPLELLRVMRELILTATHLYVQGGRLVPAALSNLLDQGISLVFNRLDEHVPTLRRLCRDIARRTSEKITAGAVVTSGRLGALKCHHDPEDLVILQIAGEKRWQIFDFPVVNPVQGLATASPPQGPLVFDRVLQQGDFLFLPAGYWHRCENCSHRSLHAVILFNPPNGQDLMATLISRLLPDETFRRPLTRNRPEELVAHETALKSLLARTADSVSLAEFLMNRAALAPIDGIHLEGCADEAKDAEL